MTIVDAHWEQRNLGLRAAEVLLAPDDQPAELPKRGFAAYDYIVAKVPSACLSLVHDLEVLGFRYLETQFEIVRDLQHPLALAPATQALLNRFECDEVTSAAGLQQVLAQVTPDMFTTDRVSLDPLFGPEIGARRYRNWIQDEMRSGQAVLCELRSAATRVGFFLLRRQGDTHGFATLAGLYSPYKGRGLGISIVAKPLQWATGHGLRRLVTRNSSNNMESFKLHLGCGYVLSDMLYLLRWTRRPAAAEDGNPGALTAPPRHHAPPAMPPLWRPAPPLAAHA